ncbi:MAG: class I SAM-dependent methyltransferase [Solirubrobacteraceae bacterium]|jgi:demethylmenaquinone methyltransferase/2-methoxy-6-polyprenyl-1,4-benzoquinol methylase
MTDDAVLAEQLDYYRARAGEYDRWWRREGRFDRGAQANARWFAETAELERVLERFDAGGDVLELACGTGLWTRHLVRTASRLTAVDASAEVLAINRARVRDARVHYVQDDLFAWTPEPSAYDACVFTFWLSHVPTERFAGFWETVARALKPGGRAFFIDSARTARSTAADHQLPDDGEETMTRRLDDGREFQIIKRFYDPPRLQSDLQALGWQAVVGRTAEFFIHGTATPPAADQS